jgi:hypothetical protein
MEACGLVVVQFESIVVVEIEIAIKPNDMKHSFCSVSDHRFLAAKAKSYESNVFGDVSRDGTLYGPSINSFQSHAVPRRLDKFIPCQETHSADLVCKCGLVVVRAARNAVVGVYESKAKGRPLAVVIGLCHLSRSASGETSPLSWFWLPKDHHP